MTNEVKKKLNVDRQNAVRDAWRLEQTFVSFGTGTVDWTYEQQKELLERGSVSGYEGHHMASVSEYPDYAGCPYNIQFLTHEEHLAAHNSNNQGGGYRSPTYGYYDTETHRMYSFDETGPQSPPVCYLSHARYEYDPASDTIVEKNSHHQNQQIAQQSEDKNTLENSSSVEHAATNKAENQMNNVPY